MAHDFSQGFDGNQVETGGLSFYVTEELIVEAKTFLSYGEQVLRSHVLEGIGVPFFLKDEFKNHNWKDGVQRAWLQDEWNWLLKIT